MVKYNPNKHHRRSIRLKDYDYARSGAYFVSICSHQHRCLLGHIAEDIMIPNEHGKIIEQEWLRTQEIRPEVEIDAFVVMPNHFHAILFIIKPDYDFVQDAHGRGMARHAPTTNTRKFSKPIPRSLPTIIGAFKSAATKRINRLRTTPGAPVWQRGYYETIIRNEGMLNIRRIYIHTNPARWADDENHPVNLKSR